MLKGDLLALLLCGKRLNVNGVVVPGSSVSLGGYRREGGNPSGKGFPGSGQMSDR